MLQDLPWQDWVVAWRVKVRRFRCGHCPGRIFAERVPGLTATKARRSERLAAAQTDIGMALGGEAGARLACRLAMPVSGDTVLRLIRRRPTPPCPAPRVGGIDDWAWRRGRRYGTIVCDLERHRVIDLLPGRSSATVRDWLAAHPSVAVVSRDRSGPYAEAARTGAPAAVQVADRWHLLVNASEALRAVVERQQPQIQDVARRCAPAPLSTDRSGRGRARSGAGRTASCTGRGGPPPSR
jgi:transposase